MTMRLYTALTSDECISLNTQVTYFTGFYVSDVDLPYSLSAFDHNFMCTLPFNR